MAMPNSPLSHSAGRSASEKTSEESQSVCCAQWRRMQKSNLLPGWIVEILPPVPISPFNCHGRRPQRWSVDMSPPSPQIASFSLTKASFSYWHLLLSYWLVRWAAKPNVVTWGQGLTLHTQPRLQAQHLACNRTSECISPKSIQKKK